MSVDTPNVDRALERFAHNVSLNARRSLQAKRKKVSIKATWEKTGGEWKPTSARRKSYLGNTVASGRLAQSLTSEVSNGAVVFEMDYYGYWVDQGRKPSRKFPPPLAIRSWLKNKKLKLRDENGKFVKNTEAARRGVAFMIGRKIKAFGIPATGFFSTIFLRHFDKLPDEIQEALLLDFDVFINKKNE